MPRLNAANNARTMLTQAIDDAVTSFTVADASIFPDPPFRITIDNEIMEVGAKDNPTNTFSSVLRGQEETTAASHADGAVVENRLTAETYDELATQASLDAHLADKVHWVNPKHYGAKFDGVTDDTAAIQAAINAAEVGGVLVFPYGETAIVSTQLTPLSGQTWFCYGCTLKWKADLTFDSRYETIYLNELEDVKIFGLTIDGNKENQSNIVYTDSIGSAFRLENSRRCLFKDITIKELPGFGFLLYSFSDYNRFENINILNCGVKRDKDWSDTYADNNFADGFYFDNASNNTVENFIIGHEAGQIQDAASMRAGICVVDGKNNIFRNGIIYNLSRPIHLEPNDSANVVADIEFDNIDVPAIGNVDHVIVVFLPTGNIKDVRFRNITAAVAKRSVDEYVASVYLNGALSLEDNYLARIEDSVFSESIHIRASKVFLNHVKCKKIYSDTTQGITKKAILSNVQAEQFLLYRARGVIIENSLFTMEDNILGTSDNGSTFASIEGICIVRRCKFVVDTLTSQVITTISPNGLEDCEFHYTGETATTGSYVTLSGGALINEIRYPLKIRGNRFFNNADVDAAYNIGSDNAFYTRLADDYVQGTFTTGHEKGNTDNKKPLV